ncbi:MAG: GDSL-type esterase/lipase family protein [Blastocatellia bacterium]
MNKSRRAVFPLLLTGLLAITTNGPGQETTARSNRRNIGLVFEKLRAGKSVTVAWLGTSVTAGAGASDPARTSWRAQVMNWLREQYPGATLTEINAGVPGTGVAYGAMRLRRDVIGFKPDLVFIEFASADQDAPDRTIRESLEGIVRQIWLQPQAPEIALLYFPRGDNRTHRNLYETVGEYYRLPAVDLGIAAAQHIEKEEITPEKFWKDVMHPYDAGQRAYAQAIIRFLESQAPQRPSLLMRQLPVFLEQEALTYGEIKPFAEFKFSRDWKMETSSDPLLPGKLLAGSHPGREFECIFDGSAVGISFRAAPDGGVIECLIDDKPAPAPLGRVDCYAKSAQLKTAIIVSGLENREHTLKIRISADKNPASSGHHIRLGTLLSGGQRPERL